MGAIRLERGKLQEKKDREVREERDTLERDKDAHEAWPQMHVGWNPSSTLHEATFTLTSSWGTWESAKTKSRMQNEGPERRRGGLVVCELPQDGGEMQLGLIRVNEAMKTERFTSMGKVKVQELKWRSEGGRAWVERAGEVMALRFGHSNACISAKK